MEAPPAPRQIAGPISRSEWLVLAALLLASLLGAALTANSYGITYDEQHYLGAGAQYAGWWGRVLTGEWRELSPGAIEEAWGFNHEHPPLQKVAAGISHSAFQSLLPGLVSYRLPSAVWFAITICALYLFTRSIWGRAGALFAALAFASMPRVFAHAHFAAFEMPVTAWFFITTALMAQALRRESCALAVLAGVSFGMALLSKVNAFFIPILLIPWALIWRRGQWGRLLLPLLVIGPALFFICWPWMWTSSFAHLREYFAFHFGHAKYNAYYLGHTYESAPWHYPLVMMAVTTPVLLLLLAIGGGVRSWPRRGVEPEQALLLLGLAVTILPNALPTSPKYNGERLFLPAFPFLAALAGGGFGWLQLQVGKLIGGRAGSAAVSAAPASARMSLLLSLLLGAALLAPGFRALVNLHPYQLAYYNALTGGVRGAARPPTKPRFETIYWGQVFLEAPAFLNHTARPAPRVFLIPGGVESLFTTFYQQWQLVNSGVRFLTQEPEVAEADYVMFQAMQSDYTPLCWELVATETATWSYPPDGTPLLLVYDRAAVGRALAALARKEAQAQLSRTASASKEMNSPTRKLAGW